MRHLAGWLAQGVRGTRYWYVEFRDLSGSRQHERAMEEWGVVNVIAFIRLMSLCSMRKPHAPSLQGIESKKT